MLLKRRFSRAGWGGLARNGAFGARRARRKCILDLSGSRSQGAQTPPPPHVDVGANVDFGENPWIFTEMYISIDVHGFPWIPMVFY